MSERAFHLSEAVPAADANEAIAALERAAKQAERHFDYEVAANAYQKALRIHRREEAAPTTNAAGAYRCRLLIGSAAMEVLAGNVELARETLAEAMDIARAWGLSEAFARAALAHAYTIDYRGSADARVIARLEEALTNLSSGNAALRAGLLARLAVELRYLKRQGERANVLLAEAADEAHASGSPTALARVLEDTTIATWSARAPRDWIELNRGIVRAARQANHDDLLFRGVKGLATGAMEIGDAAGMRREMDRCRALAAECPAPFQRAVVTLHDTSRLLLEGEFQRAEAGALEVLATGIPDVADIGMLQLYYLRLETGRIGELEAVIRHAAHDFPVWQMPIARMLADLDRFDEARRVLQSLDDPDELPRDRLWLPCMAGLAEVAAVLEARPLAASLYAALAPFAELNVIHPHGAIYFGNVSYFLALLARVAGEFEQAAAHLRNGAAAHERMGAKAWNLRTRLEALRLSRLAGHATIDARALDAFEAEADALGMGALARDVDRERRK